MIKPDLSAVPEFYQRYVDNVIHYEVLEALKVSSAETIALLSSVSDEKGNYRYAAGKWSIKELLCHMMDAERIFAYRALRFARNDKTALPGFEENDYAPQANADNRKMKNLVEEMQRLRLTTVDLFASFTPEMLDRTGVASKVELSVLTIGYIISGHETHHRKILSQRYLS